MAGFFARVKRAFNVLTAEDLYQSLPADSMHTSVPPKTYNAWRDNVTSVLAPIRTRIAMDAAAIPVQHVMVDEEGSFLSVRKGHLNDRLTHSANIDQTGTAFIQDAVETMLLHGNCVLVPIEMTTDPRRTTAYDLLSVRVGVVTQWYSQAVEVEVYNELTGDNQCVVLPKSLVAICVNPFYNVMNRKNSTLDRLINKLALLDVTDSKQNGPNLDLILQLPYALNNEKRKDEALRRANLVEQQLYETHYGLAYIGATEKVTQLNRPVTNNLMTQVEYLTTTLYNQLGLTQPILSGTASQEEVISYQNRTVLPVLTAIVEGIRKTFLTKTAIKQGQSIMAFSPLFKMAPLDMIAEAVDKFTRNEVLTGNEVRSYLGLPRVDDPEADELRNKNLNKPTEEKEVV